MGIRHFKIRSPRPDFTGRIGAVSFADEHRVQVGRSAVLFAQRRPGYQVTEVDSAGNPITDSTPTADSNAVVARPARSTSKKES